MKIVLISIGAILVIFIIVQLFAMRAQYNIETYPYKVVKEYDEFDLSYDLEKIPKYTLPDPLTTKNGNKIKSIEEWENIQRKELIL